MPAELATSLGPPTDDDLLLQAEAAVRTYCGWHIAPVRTTTLVLQPRGYTVLLPTLRLVEVVALENNLLELAPPETYSYTSDGVLELPRETVPTWRAYWGQRYSLAPSPITVTFRHGYDEVPADVAGAVRGLAMRAKGNPGALLSRTTGPFSESYGSDLFGADRGTLDLYRLPARLGL